jgi:hypothetical protein
MARRINKLNNGKESVGTLLNGERRRIESNGI